MTLMSLLTVCAFAQQEPETFAIQPKVGVNVSTLGEGTWKPGFVAGIEGTYKFNDWFGVTFGADYSQEGAKVKSSRVPDGFKNMSLTTSYVNVPVLLDFYITKGLAFKTGIQPGFNVYNQVKAKDFSGNEYTEDKIDDLKSINISVPVGLSYEVGGVILDARYNIGVTNVLSDDYYDYTAHGNVLQFTIGYKFKL